MRDEFGKAAAVRSPISGHKEFNRQSHSKTPQKNQAMQQQLRANRCGSLEMKVSSIRFD
jgi:hypothetical protein